MARGWAHGPREASRVAALRRYELLDRPVDADLEAIAALAAQVCGMPHAAVNLMDHERQWQAAAVGAAPDGCARDEVCCAAVIAAGEPVHVPDTAVDDRAPASPSTTGVLGAYRSYAASPLVTPDGHVIGALCVHSEDPRALDADQLRALDVLAGQVVALFELRTQARALARVTARFRIAFENASVGMALVDASGCWSRVNRALARILGEDVDALLGSSLEEVVFEEDLPAVRAALRALRAGGAVDQRLEVRLLHRSGRSVWAALWAAAGEADHGDVVDLVVQVDDITERKAADEELHRRATHDHLTGLPNRLLLADRLGTAVERLRRGLGEVTVMLVDLDGFKAVNDSRGHGAGDLLLVAIAQRLRRALRASDTVVRLGGDEFVIVCEERTPTGEGRRIAERVLQVLAAPLAIEGLDVRVGASVGVVTTTEWVEPEELLRRADDALYCAKAGGRGRVELSAV